MMSCCICRQALTPLVQNMPPDVTDSLRSKLSPSTA